MSSPFLTTRLVEFADTDMAGIMHFASFFRYMESAEHEMLRSWGYSIFDEHHGQTISFPRVATSCQYQAPARSEDVLEISVAVRKVGTKSVTYQFDFACQGKPIATGEIVAVCCRIEHGQPPKSVPIPDDLAQHLREVQQSPTNS
jgi:4-hydroxybenzoyl-CoA thioesterase/acyl-CoA thioester hydrolase